MRRYWIRLLFKSLVISIKNALKIMDDRTEIPPSVFSFKTSVFHLIRPILDMKKCDIQRIWSILILKAIYSKKWRQVARRPCSGSQRRFMEISHLNSSRIELALLKLMAAMCAINDEMLILLSPNLWYFKESCCCNNISEGFRGQAILLSCFLNNYFFIIKLKGLKLKALKLEIIRLNLK